MNQIGNRRISRNLFLACSVFFLMGSQLSFGQSVPDPPKKSPEMIELEGKLNESLNYQAQIEKAMAAITDKSHLLQTELTKLRDLESQMSVSEESYPEVLKTLHSQRVQLSIDLAGIDARYAAIEKAIAQISAEQTDSQISPLQKLVEIRAKELEKLQRLADKGAVPNSDLRKAEIAILEAKARLAQIMSNSSGPLGHLNAQLLDATLEQAEKTARLAQANHLIKEAQAYRTHATKVNKTQQGISSVGIEIHVHRQEMERIKKLVTKYEAELEQLTANQK